MTEGDIDMDHSGFSRSKTYVDVSVNFDKDGHMIPVAIIWKDGRIYHIDRLLDTRAAFSARCGGRGDLYLVRIRNTSCHLFFERNPYRSSPVIGRWFVSAV